MNLFNNALCAASCSIFVIACGGGGGGDGAGGGGADDTPPLMYDGQFLDSAVEGLTYQSGSNPSGTTDANGTFTYSPGETLSFSLGGVEIGALRDGAAVITPFDFGAAAAENIARFLQTLDADNDPLNGIDLTAAATALASTTLSASVFESDRATFETDIASILEVALGPGAMLIDEATAIAHLVSQTISRFEGYVFPGHGRVAVFPEINEIGVMSFGSSAVETMWDSDTIHSGGNGTSTLNDWSVDENGVLVFTDPTTLNTVTIENVGSNPRATSIVMTDALELEPIVGTLLAPVPVTVFSLAGESGRTYDLSDGGNPDQVSRITFFPDGTLLRLENEVQYNETWQIDSHGILIKILESDLSAVRIFVMLNGSVANGGNILSIYTTNLSGNSTASELQFDAMYEGTLEPNIASNPDGTIPYSFSTADKYFVGIPGETFTEISDYFSDMSVSGTFDYDDSLVARDVDDNGQLIGWPHYDLSFLNLAGSVNGMQFSDPSGVTVVVNDLFDRSEVNNPTGFSDLFQLAADSVVVRTEDSETLISDLVGFEVIGFTLVNVRLLWVEGSFEDFLADSVPVPDFLSNGNLPALLPDIPGALFLDFTTPTSPDEVFGVYFPALLASPSTVNPTP